MPLVLNPIYEDEQRGMREILSQPKRIQGTCVYLFECKKLRMDKESKTNRFTIFEKTIIIIIIFFEKDSLK